MSLSGVAAVEDVSDDAVTTTSLAVTKTTPAVAAAVGAADVRYGMLSLFATVIVLGVIILATIVGNAFVIAAIVLERKLRGHVANYLVASLAVADLLVALLVMPLAVVNEVSWRWFLGGAVCAAWTTLDLICCTSSILHLLAISFDRYWAVTRLDYIHHRSTRRIVFMIAASWTGSVVISAPPLFLEYSPDTDPDITGLCVINESLAYTVFSTVGAFYLPFVMMMIVYVKVFRAAQARIRHKRFRPRPAATETYVVTRVLPEHCSQDSGAQTPQPALNGTTEVDVPQDQLNGAMPVVHVLTAEEKFDSEAGLSRLSDDERAACNNDATDHVLFTEELVSDDIGALADACRQSRLRHIRHSESDVIATSPWIQPSDHTAAATATELRMIQSLTMVRSGSNETAASSRGELDQVGMKTEQHPDDEVFEAVQTVQDSNCPGSRPPDTVPTRLPVGGLDDTLLGPPVCTVTSPTEIDRQFAEKSPLPDHNHLTGSLDMDRLRLPRKAADRLLTPTTSPVHHRASWADLTRALFASSSVLRVHLHGPPSGSRQQAEGRTTRQVIAQRRERKAARTLAVITGTFVLCWLPFFIVAILRPFCADHCHYPALLISVIVWLGYANSLLNPIIYTLFNADFRSAFRKILFGKYRRHRQ